MLLLLRNWVLYMSSTDSSICMAYHSKLFPFSLLEIILLILHVLRNKSIWVQGVAQHWCAHALVGLCKDPQCSLRIS